MAEYFPSVPGIISFTTGASDVLTQVHAPNNARSVRILFETNAGKIAVDGTDGGAIGATAHLVAQADTEVLVYLDQDALEQGKGPAQVYVTSATASTVVRMLCESSG